mmetsp:Transcript_10158/g.26118  ORF Transcript_10158/g.26118 Transcript_10158/m.26118 type:complete len:262 (-) Transcript_10158:155-940(-)
MAVLQHAVDLASQGDAVASSGALDPPHVDLHSNCAGLFRQCGLGEGVDVSDVRCEPGFAQRCDRPQAPKVRWHAEKHPVRGNAQIPIHRHHPSRARHRRRGARQGGGRELRGDCSKGAARVGKKIAADQDEERLLEAQGGFLQVPIYSTGLVALSLLNEVSHPRPRLGLQCLQNRARGNECQTRPKLLVQLQAELVRDDRGQATQLLQSILHTRRRCSVEGRHTVAEPPDVRGRGRCPRSCPGGHARGARCGLRAARGECG